MSTDRIFRVVVAVFRILPVVGALAILAALGYLVLRVLRLA